MSSDLTVKILEKIHEEIRGQREDHRGLTAAMNAGFEAMNARFETMNTTMNARFEILETTLRDLAQQLVMLTRGVKVAIEAKGANDERLTDHERRIANLEQRLG